MLFSYGFAVLLEDFNEIRGLEKGWRRKFGLWHGNFIYVLQDFPLKAFFERRWIAYEALYEETDVMQAVLDQELVNPVVTRRPEENGRKVGFFASVFGCWHKRLSKPISDKNSTYQVCVECGARRRYDMNDFSPKGRFYYPPMQDVRTQLGA